MVQKVKEGTGETRWDEVTKNEEVIDLLRSNSVQLRQDIVHVVAPGIF
jgi:hypothetical protein